MTQPNLIDAVGGEGFGSLRPQEASVPTEAVATCGVCDSTGWVCEYCNDTPWEGLSSREDACHCGAGAPCWICNREMALAGPLHEARDHIRALLAQLDKGWGCCCTFPSDTCCAISRAETYLADPVTTPQPGMTTAKSEE